jgi:signal transduction histidine kinase
MFTGSRAFLHDRITGTIELLRRTLGEQVTLTLRLSPTPCQTMANPGDVDNAILNLAINARDAMSNGGMLTIETSHVTLDANIASRVANARPGDYVTFTVSDTGHGMSAEVLKHAMEPLFTTKELGKGTGLGLATVHSSGAVVPWRSLGLSAAMLRPLGGRTRFRHYPCEPQIVDAATR